MLCKGAYVVSLIASDEERSEAGKVSEAYGSGGTHEERAALFVAAVAGGVQRRAPVALLTVGVSSCLEEELDAACAVVVARCKERRVAIEVGMVDVGAGGDEERQTFRVAFFHAKCVKRRLARQTRGWQVDRRASVEEELRTFGMAMKARGEQWAQAVTISDVDSGASADEHLAALWMAAEADNVQSGAAVWNLVVNSISGSQLLEKFPFLLAHRCFGQNCPNDKFDTIDTTVVAGSEERCVLVGVERHEKFPIVRFARMLPALHAGLQLSCNICFTSTMNGLSDM